jgi:septation ring formation regulator EzrA
MKQENIVNPITHACNQEKNVEKILERINALEITSGKTDTLIAQFIKTNDKLSETLTDVKSTMVGIHHALESNEKEIGKLNMKFDKLKDDGDKNKIDMRDIWKSYFLKIGFGFAGIYVLYDFIVKFASK